MTQNEVPINVNHNVLSRAQGCLLGQLAGDALGSLVEFQTPEQIDGNILMMSGIWLMAEPGTQLPDS